MANEKPMVVVEACIDVMGEVIGKDCGDSRGSVVRKGEAPLRHGGCRSVRERVFDAENGDVSRNRGGSGHWGSEVFASRGGDEYVVGINGDIFVKRGEEEGIEDFLSDLGRRRRHG